MGTRRVFVATPAAGMQRTERGYALRPASWRRCCASCPSSGRRRPALTLHEFGPLLANMTPGDWERIGRVLLDTRPT